MNVLIIFEGSFIAILGQQFELYRCSNKWNSAARRVENLFFGAKPMWMVVPDD
jgi:hypothetical protein